jgi:hypothetical protein
MFPQLKLRVKGYQIQTLDSILKAVTIAIMTLTEADFQFHYEAWKICWAKYIASNILF